MENGLIKLLQVNQTTSNHNSDILILLNIQAIIEKLQGLFIIFIDKMNKSNFKII